MQEPSRLIAVNHGAELIHETLLPIGLDSLNKERAAVVDGDQEPDTQLIPRISGIPGYGSRGVLRLLSTVCWLALFAVGISAAAQNAPARAISTVTVSRPFFNPALGQKVAIAFSIARAGSLEVDILDSDRSPVRRVLSRPKARPGPATIDWNGRDERGVPLPDGVYSLAIKLVWSSGSETYSPGALPAEEWIVYGATYDPRSAVIGYQLSKPARVLLTAQAFSARTAASATPDVLRKVVANWEPRVAGSVIEQWNGFDESGRVYMPEHPKFLLMVKAKALPENAIITVGNRIALPVARR